MKQIKIIFLSLFAFFAAVLLAVAGVANADNDGEIPWWESQEWEEQEDDRALERAKKEWEEESAKYKAQQAASCGEYDAKIRAWKKRKKRILSLMEKSEDCNIEVWRFFNRALEKENDEMCHIITGTSLGDGCARKTSDERACHDRHRFPLD